MLKNTVSLLLLLSLTFQSSSAVFAQSCMNLFIEKNELSTSNLNITLLKSNHPRVLVSKVISSPDQNMTEGQRIRITDSIIPDTDAGVSELFKMALHNSSFIIDQKNLFHKDKLYLGLKINEELYFELAYTAEGSQSMQFILNKIVLKSTKSSEEIKVFESVKPSDLNKYILKNISLLPSLNSIELRIPYILKGQVLEKFYNLSAGFKFYSKDELRHYSEKKTLLQLKTNIKLRSAQDIFKKVLVKEPFKLMISGVMMYLVIQTAGEFKVKYSTVKPPEATQVTQTIQIPEIDKTDRVAPAVRRAAEIQIESLKLELKEKILQNKLSQVSSNELSLYGKPLTLNSISWIYKYNEDKKVKYFFVISEEFTTGNLTQPEYKFIVYELDPIKYSQVIKLYTTVYPQ